LLRVFQRSFISDRLGRVDIHFRLISAAPGSFFSPQARAPVLRNRGQHFSFSLFLSLRFFLFIFLFLYPLSGKRGWLME
jgi:hypothetical protein